MRARVYWYDGRKSVWTQHTTTGCHEATTRDTEWTRLTCTHKGTQRGPEGIQQIWLAIDQWRNHNYNTTKIHHMNQTAILCMHRKKLSLCQVAKGELPHIRHPEGQHSYYQPPAGDLKYVTRIKEP